MATLGHDIRFIDSQIRFRKSYLRMIDKLNNKRKTAGDVGEGSAYQLYCCDLLLLKSIRSKLLMIKKLSNDRT